MKIDLRLEVAKVNYPEEWKAFRDVILKPDERRTTTL